MPESEPCPLCGSAKHMPRAKPLYGTLVCKKCYYRMVNRRQMAFVFDALLWWPISIGLGFAIGWLMVQLQASREALIAADASFSWVILPMIFILKDGFNGQSPGKAIAGLQVVDPDTVEPTGFVRSWMRNLPLIVPIVPLIIAFTLGKGKRWGDGWADTKVILKKYADHPLFTGGLACENCHYSLIGNTSGACPECGKQISQANLERLRSAPPLQAS